MKFSNKIQDSSAPVKWVHDNFKAIKHYTVDVNWAGVHSIKEYRGGAFATSLSLTREQAASFMEIMTDNGWYTEQSRTDGDDSRSCKEVRGEAASKDDGDHQTAERGR